MTWKMLMVAWIAAGLVHQAAATIGWLAGSGQPVISRETLARFCRYGLFIAFWPVLAMAAAWTLGHAEAQGDESRERLHRQLAQAQAAKSGKGGAK